MEVTATSSAVDTNGSVQAPVGSPFALEFERAKTKVLSREVKKLRKAMIHGDMPGNAVNHGFSRGSNGRQGNAYTS